MSKGLDMIGWRMGFVAGHPLLVRAFADVKDNADSGQSWPSRKRRRRHWPTRAFRCGSGQVRAAAAQAGGHGALAGFEAEMPGGTYFLYTPAPRGGGRPDVRDGRDVSEFLIRDRSICTVPWDDAGPHCDGRSPTRPPRGGRGRPDGVAQAAAGGRPVHILKAPGLGGISL